MNDAAPFLAVPGRLALARGLVVAVAVIALLGAGLLAMRSRSIDQVTLVVTPPVNVMAQAQHCPLAPAGRLTRTGLFALSAPTSALPSATIAQRKTLKQGQ